MSRAFSEMIISFVSLLVFVVQMSTAIPVSIVREIIVPVVLHHETANRIVVLVFRMEMFSVNRREARAHSPK